MILQVGASKEFHSKPPMGRTLENYPGTSLGFLDGWCRCLLHAIRANKRGYCMFFVYVLC